jgi:hypothetical protein
MSGHVVFTKRLAPQQLALFSPRGFWTLLAVWAFAVTALTATTITAPVSANGCPTAAVWTTGAGTTASPYQISTTAHLLHLAATDTAWDKHFVQTQPIDLTGCTWTPIGRVANLHSKPAFTGSFDGGDKSIAGLSIDLSGEGGDAGDIVGLFGYAEGATLSAITLTGSATGFRRGVGGLVGQMSGGLIENVTVSVTVATTDRVIAGPEDSAGGIVGTASHVTIRNAHASGNVTGTYQVGGLIGRAIAGTRIIGSSATGTVTGEPLTTGNYRSDAVGGLVGFLVNSQIENSVATGNVTTGIQARRVGGLVGYVRTDEGNATVSASSASGAVIGTSNVGGLIGSIGNGPISVIGSFATGPVTGAGEVGGLVGDCYSTFGIRTSHATGDVTASGESGGGLIGDARCPVEDSYARGAVTGQGYIGGLIGYHVQESGSDHVINSYATGSVTATGDYAGGLIGYIWDRRSSTTVSAVSASGAVSGADGVGGLIGWYYPNAVTYSLMVRDATTSSTVTGNQAGGAIGGLEGLVVLHDVVLSGITQGTSNSDQLIGCFVGSVADAADENLTRSGTTRSTGTKVIGGVSQSCTPGGNSSTPPGSGVSVTPPTTTTVPAPAVPAPVPDGGALPRLSPGASQVIQDGVPVTVEVFVDNTTDLVVRGPDFELRLAGECARSCAIETSADGRQVLTLEERGLANVSGEGFQSGSPVYVWLFSEPRFLGELTVNADGTFTGIVPLGDIAPGEHTLQVNGISSDGLPRTANLGVRVNPLHTSPPVDAALPTTGSDPRGLWLVGMVMLAAGAAMLSRRRPKVTV